jgi:ABC-type transport system involved in multi-copper enzyme maturation permease subunit
MANLKNIIAHKEISYLLREKTFVYAVFIFIAMAILSTIIWWSTQHTVITVYDYASNLIKSLWQIPPVLTLKSESSLLIVKNMIIYNTLIATLVVLIMWYYIWMNDRIANVIKLIFTRPIRKYELFLWKAIAIISSLFILILASFIITDISLMIFGAFSTVNLLNVLWFYALSFIYVLWFWFIGLGFSYIAKDSWNALLYSLIIWIIITFVLPELSSALNPTNSLNPVLPNTNILQSSPLQTIHNLSFPFSVSEHYKNISSELIWISDPTAPNYYKNDFYDISVLIIWMILSFTFAIVWINKLDASNWDIS